MSAVVNGQSRKRMYLQIERNRQLKIQNILLISYGIGIVVIIALMFYILRRMERIESALQERETIVKEEQSFAEKENLTQMEEVISNTVITKDEKDNIAAYATKCEAKPEDLNMPAKHSRSESLRILKTLSTEYEEIAQVVEDSDRYTDHLLESLANNPEMADFAVGYFSREGQTPAELTSEEKRMEYPLFLQWDPRWGYDNYGDVSNIGLSGCGPTALSMVLYYLTGDETLLPGKIGEYAMQNGYYLPGTGTMWSLMEEVPQQYGIASSQLEKSEELFLQELDQGNFIICSMRPGDFTAAGHFIVIYGYNEEGLLVNDPNCVTRSRKIWTYEELEWQIKQAWTFAKIEYVKR